MATPRARLARTWITLVEAAQLMGVVRTTAYRRLRPYLRKKMHGGRVQNVVLLSRVRQHLVGHAEDIDHMPTEIEETFHEFRKRMEAIERAQRVLAGAVRRLQTRGVG